GIGDGAPRGFRADGRRGLFMSGDIPPLMDPGALDDPLVARVHVAGEVGVGDDVVGDVIPESPDVGVGHDGKVWYEVILLRGVSGVPSGGVPDYRVFSTDCWPKPTA